MARAPLLVGAVVAVPLLVLIVVSLRLAAHIPVSSGDWRYFGTAPHALRVHSSSVTPAPAVARSGHAFGSSQVSKTAQAEQAAGGQTATAWLLGPHFWVAFFAVETMLLEFLADLSLGLHPRCWSGDAWRMGSECSDAMSLHVFLLASLCLAAFCGLHIWLERRRRARLKKSWDGCTQRQGIQLATLEDSGVSEAPVEFEVILTLERLLQPDLDVHEWFDREFFVSARAAGVREKYISRLARVMNAIDAQGCHHHSYQELLVGLVPEQFPIVFRFREPVGH